MPSGVEAIEVVKMKTTPPSSPQPMDCQEEEKEQSPPKGAEASPEGGATHSKSLAPSSSFAGSAAGTSSGVPRMEDKKRQKLQEESPNSSNSSNIINHSSSSLENRRSSGVVVVKRNVDSVADSAAKTGEEKVGIASSIQLQSSARQETYDDEDEGVEVVLQERGDDKIVEDQHQRQLRSAPSATSNASTASKQQQSPYHPHSHSRPTPDQDVFRHPQTVRPRPMRAQHSGPHPPPPYALQGSGSWGAHSYGGHGPPPGHYPPPPHMAHHPDYPPPPPHMKPYPVPPYASSASFEDQASYHHNSHYSPHVQYPPPGSRGYADDINVISPNHKSDPQTPNYPQRGPPMAPRPRHLQHSPYPPPPNHHHHQPPPPSHHHHSYYQYPPASPVSRPVGSSSAAPTAKSPPSGGPPPPPRVRSYQSPPPGMSGPPPPGVSSRHRPPPPDGPYGKPQREYSSHYGHHYPPPPEDPNASWGSGSYHAPPPTERNPSSDPMSSSNTSRPRQSSSQQQQSSQQPPLITESSFDSEHQSRRSHPNTPSVATAVTTPPHPPTSSGSAGPGPGGSDPHYQFYQGGSWGSFDSAGAALGSRPPPHFDDHRYYSHYPPHHPHPPAGPPPLPHTHSLPLPPESPYSPYMSAPYSPPGLYSSESFPPPPQYGPTGSFSYSYDDTEERFLKDYHPDRDGAAAAAANGEEHQGHHHHHPTNSLKNQVTPPGNSKPKSRKSSTTNTSNNSMLLPKAAEEIDFDVTDPPAEPVTPPGEEPICESLADVNSYDVLCGRGGGTNSQVGNRRFRKLVQEFQPTYLLARRKEKPLLARTIVLIIRKRGGRFLKKDEDTGELFEVGDAKAEAKTSQALREGLDVRATKSAASSLLEKKKKKKGGASTSSRGGGNGDSDSEDDIASPTPSAKSRASSVASPPHENTGSTPDGRSATPTQATVHDSAASLTPKKVPSSSSTPLRPTADSPPTLPRLGGEEFLKSGLVHPHSPVSDNLHFRKRRRMRGSNGSTGGDSRGASVTIGSNSAQRHRHPPADRFFPDFCPPRADLGRPASPENVVMENNLPTGCCSPMQLSTTPIRRPHSHDHDDGIHYDQESVQPQGCTGIALEMVTGAATSSFSCLGPVSWRR